MERTQLKQDLLAVFRPFMRRVPNDFVISETTSLIKDIGIDSADMIDLMLSIEERFSIEIQDEQVDRIKTFGDLVGVVQKLTSRN
jgi:acyl carrier protein